MMNLVIPSGVMGGSSTVPFGRVTTTWSIALFVCDGFSIVLTILSSADAVPSIVPETVLEVVPSVPRNAMTGSPSV